ncbi:unnamed protein product [Darwinula stevensoni]|uniref:Uncharacterized protein n=1 Tax=Darwinula stevensoni TaxID=69355 RepID=A0A7R9A2R2_9CRUS|nr:unnamed protein product [Darwinula stevensoni]CAG0880026.1 unnamed protein product [Darwinula stevensoni]
MAKGKGKAACGLCGKKCSGEVLKVQDNYFHVTCFKCAACNTSLERGGFFFKENNYYCTRDYQKYYGTKCGGCGEYVEGEVVTALGNTYHRKCFRCGRCKEPFPSGDRVTFTGKDCLCQRCLHIPIVDSHSPPTSPSSLPKCGGCGEELKEGQSLIALDNQWHVWCFRCAACSVMLSEGYKGKDAKPYCEKDYQKLFGVKCAYCGRFINGKVLQAGEIHHFHPTCARCSKCGDPFGDGEEMYVQGAAIWHPRCGPGPDDRPDSSLLADGHLDGDISARELEGLSSISDTQYSGRMYSPGLILRDYRSPYGEDITRIYTYSYLTAEPSLGYLRRPIHPYDKAPKSPQFHRPDSSERSSSRVRGKQSSKSAMKALVDRMVSETPRPRSPHMNNEEPIELAHFPSARPPTPGETPKIERDDFPAPPFPYTDPERRRHWSGSTKDAEPSDEEDQVDTGSTKENVDPKIMKEEAELSKIAGGIGKVFLSQVREREKLRQWKLRHIDPRNASRTPSAKAEPHYGLRYQSPVNASPSRYSGHPRPWEEEEFDRSSSYRSSMGRSVGTIPSYNVVSSLRQVPKPGYGLKAATLPAAGRNGGPAGMLVSPYYPSSMLRHKHPQTIRGGFPLASALRPAPRPGYGQGRAPYGYVQPPPRPALSTSALLGDYSIGLGDTTHSTDLSVSGKSDMSAPSLMDGDGRISARELRVSETFTSGLRSHPIASAPHLRQSLPNMGAPSEEPPKIYPLHLLLTTNYRLPGDVDRCNLERHLSDVDFEAIFHMSRTDFYRLPQWRRNDMKKRAKLY